jgi:hypothetical protein
MIHDEKAALETLEKLEWMYLADIRPELLPMCPICHGTKHEHRFLSWTKDKPMQGHKPGCSLALALGREMPNHAPPLPVTKGEP